MGEFMRKITSQACLGIVMMLSLSSLALGHARLLPNSAFSPRDTRDGIKPTSGAPCGSTQRSANPVILKAGQEVEIEFEETINHPGYFRILFSPANDLGFENNIIVDRIEDNLPADVRDRKFKATITVPTTLCDNCTIQMIQVMTENNMERPYFSCVDVQIKNANDPTVTVPTAPQGLKIKSN